ncbi:MAG: hypothetical protein LBB49_03290 [Gracilibacteraceae bacterium]|jgi:nitrogen fixation/metabolism regulation signal transduction histidine kinase|nr:hypothetical protein [Gracilibacteraceae bacterium]
MAESKTYVKPKGNPMLLRVIAVVLWVLGLACETAGILIILKQYPIVWIVIALVLDLILVVIGSFLWKKANKIDPPSEKNKVEFFIKTQLGAIIAVIAFFPILIILLMDKNMDKKVKTWVSILAGICLVVAVGLSIDYDPISLEDLEQMRVNTVSSDFGNGIVQWSKNSKVYHTWGSCSSLKRILEANLSETNVDDAFEKGKTRMCRFCASNFGITEGVDTGNTNDDDTD